MTNRLIIVFCRATLVGLLVASAGCALHGMGRAGVDASSPAGAVTAINRFGFDLYSRAVREAGNGGNLICSPLSAAVALTMTAAGARGETLAEMTHVLHLDASKLSEAHDSFAGLVTALNKRDGQDGMALRVSDRLFAQAGSAFLPDFVAFMRDRSAPFSLSAGSSIRRPDRPRTRSNFTCGESPR